MDFLIPFTVIFLCISPIVVPLFMWYVLKIRESKIYKLMRLFRYLLAVLVLLVMAMNFMKSQNFYESIGGAFANLLMAYLLCKKWKVKEETDDIPVA
jgi:hypothetical protein